MSLKDKLNAKTQKLSQQLKELNDTSFAKDERYWRPTTDKVGNGSAVIRFLPAPEGEEIPFIRKWSHAFQGPGGWYIENSLTTLKQDDPVSVSNSRLWNGTDEEKELARSRKRKLTFTSNIYVVSDPAAPENEGKVFLYEYGKKIFDKINDSWYPEDTDQAAVNPFDLWEGANFRLKVKKVAGYPNYDSSTFASPKALSDDDEVLETIYAQEHSLLEIVDPKNFKSYEELEKRFNKVIGEDGETPGPKKSSAPKAAHATAKAAEPEDEDNQEDMESFFKRMAEADD